MSEPTDIIGRLETLGLAFPTDCAFIPSNVFRAESKEDLHYPKLTPDLEKALEDGGIQLERLSEPSSRFYVELRGIDWFLPVLAVGHAIASDPNALQIVLNIISSYLYDRMKRLKRDSGTVRMSLVKRGAGTCEWLNYEGPVEGLRLLAEWRTGSGPTQGGGDGEGSKEA
jgi:hypothetical protein